MKRFIRHLTKFQHLLKGSGRGVKESSPHAIKLSDEQQNIFRILEDTHEHLFITGKAGTGKSALLKYFAANTAKNVIKVAPTGIAATIIKGQTIHSLFKLAPGFIEVRNIKVNDQTRQLLRHVDTIIIDEISMVRADMIDGIDRVLQIAKRSKLPFGGAQLVAFGDVYQLPPVVESLALRNYFASVHGGPYFFNALVWNRTKLQTYELVTVFRQSNKRFKAVLDAVRNGNPSQTDFETLHERLIDTEQIPAGDIITLTSTNAAANVINQTRMAALQTRRKRMYYATVVGTAMASSFPTERELLLRVGAQVLFLKNDPGHRWVNGTIGTVKSVSKHFVKVQCGNKVHEVEPVTWEQYRYYYDEKSKTIEQETTGTFTQLPLKLAWAITIHKAQGCTYKKVIVDLRGGAFTHGQTYVALSRCKSLDDLYLLGEIRPGDIIVEPAIVNFMKQAKSEY